MALLRNEPTRWVGNGRGWLDEVKSGQLFSLALASASFGTEPSTECSLKPAPNAALEECACQLSNYGGAGHGSRGGGMFIAMSRRYVREGMELSDEGR